MSTTMPHAATSTSGASSRGNRGGQGRRGGASSSGTSSSGVRSASPFRGSTPEINGNVFQRFEEQQEQRRYIKTMEALEAYVKTKLDFSEDLAPLFGTPSSNHVLEEPVDIAKDAGELKKMMFAEEVKIWMRRSRQLRSNLATLHTVIWGQCSDDMKSKVKTHEGYKEKTAENDCHWLLRQIKSVTMQYNTSRHGRLALQEALQSYYNCIQEPGQSIEDYVYCIQSWVETIESHGGSVDINLGMVAENDKHGDPIPLETRMIMGREGSMATAIIRGADKSKYGSLVTSLANDYAKGRDEYPIDALGAQALLVHYKTPVNASNNNQS